MNARRMAASGLALALAAGVALSTTGCIVVQTVEREERTDRVQVEREGAEQVEAKLDMGAGELLVNSSRLGDEVMDAEFDYSIKSWQPEVDYDVRAGTGHLDVRQPSTRDFGPFSGDYRYAWDIEFDEDVPLYLDVNMGAGEADMDLSDVVLHELALSFGAGDVTLDLAGAYEDDVDVRLDAGAGAMTIYLPENIGVSVEIDQGIGEIVANGFLIDDGRYVNEAYDDADVFVDVDIDAGVGQITLVLEGSE